MNAPYNRFSKAAERYLSQHPRVSSAPFGLFVTDLSNGHSMVQAWIRAKASADPKKSFPSLLACQHRLRREFSPSVRLALQAPAVAA